MTTISDPQEHIHATRGNDKMEKSKAFKFDNSTVIIHHELACMNQEEQKEWFRRERENKRPQLLEFENNLARIINEINNEELARISNSNNRNENKA